MLLDVIVKQKKNLNLLLNSKCGGMITKTCTEDIRNGNPEPRYYHNDELSINSMGLPNNGLKYYLKYYHDEWKRGLNDDVCREVF
jgi:dihydroorotate dehydrogenase (fumarate)